MLFSVLASFFFPPLKFRCLITLIIGTVPKRIRISHLEGPFLFLSLFKRTFPTHLSLSVTVHLSDGSKAQICGSMKSDVSLQVRALVRNARLLHRRRPCSVICSVVLPVIFAAIAAMLLVLFTHGPGAEVHVETGSSDLSSLVPSFVQNCRGLDSCVLGFTPDNAEIRSLADAIVPRLVNGTEGKVVPSFFGTKDELFGAIKKNGAGVLLGVVVEDLSGSSLNYTLVSNSTSLPMEARHHPNSPSSMYYHGFFDPALFDTSGLAMTSQMIDSWSFGVSLDFKTRPLPRIDNDWNNRVAPTIGMTLAVLALLASVSFFCFVSFLFIEEKKSRSAELLFTLGLQKHSFWIFRVLMFLMNAIFPVLATVVPPFIFSVVDWFVTTSLRRWR